MPRTARIVAPGYFYHVTQRGNNRQVIFCDDHDRQYYLSMVERYRYKYALEIHAFCLMSNHVHFIARPADSEGLARTFQMAHMRYAQYFNKKYRSCGHVWQGRFFSCLLSDQHLAAAVRYVELNPVRAKLVKKACDWEWSSAKQHVRGEQCLLELANIKSYVAVASWEEYLDNDDEQGVVETIRKNTKEGKVVGERKLIESLEALLNRNLTKRRIGRPRKSGK